MIATSGSYSLIHAVILLYFCSHQSEDSTFTQDLSKSVHYVRRKWHLLLQFRSSQYRSSHIQAEWIYCRYIHVSILYIFCGEYTSSLPKCMYVCGKQQSFIEPVAKKMSAWIAFGMLWMRLCLSAHFMYSIRHSTFEQKNRIWVSNVWSAVKLSGPKNGRTHQLLSVGTHLYREFFILHLCEVRYILLFIIYNTYVCKRFHRSVRNYTHSHLFDAYIE